MVTIEFLIASPFQKQRIIFFLVAKIPKLKYVSSIVRETYPFVLFLLITVVFSASKWKTQIHKDL